MAATQPQNGGGPPVSALQLIRARLFAAAQQRAAKRCAGLRAALRNRPGADAIWQAEYAHARFSLPLRSAA
jgi:hypothetical protein